MRRHLSNISAISRAAGFGLVTAAIVAAAVHFDRRKAEPQSTAARAAPSVDPLAAELARCQALGMAAQNDASCKAVSAENRRRFFAYRSEDSKTAATPPQSSTPKIEIDKVTGGTGVIDAFLATFTQYIDSGFGLVQRDVRWMAGVLIAIDITLAGQVWNERIGSARVQAKNWRLAFFGALALSGGLAGGLVWQSAHGTITPWVVQVDRLGQAQAVAPAVADYRPTDPQIAWHLARFITQVRSIPADPVVLRQNWLDAYDYVTDKGALTLNDYARTNDPFSGLGKMQVAVEVLSVIRASDDSFRVEWIERRYVDNASAATERWSAILTVVVQTPADADRLKKNPLGVYVHALNWSKELG